MEFSGRLPEALHEGFSTEMGQSILLPAAVILVGAAVALFFAKPKAVNGWGAVSAQVHAGVDPAGGQPKFSGQGH